MKTLYATDLDGTLLNSQTALDDFTVETLNALLAKGMYFTYATARSFSSASVLTSRLHLTMPIVAYNGTFLYSPKGEVLRCYAFSNDEKLALIAQLNKHQVYPLTYKYAQQKETVSWVVGKETEGLLYYLSKKQSDKRRKPVETIDQLYDGGIFYITCIGPQKDLAPIYEDVRRLPFCNCVFQQELYREEYWLEIMPRQATKANALLRLKEQYGCNKLVVFGDGLNDFPMFQIADQCYAVQNAADALKSIATGVIESNDSNGVAKWLASHYVSFE